MTTINKENIYIDRHRQNRERNNSLCDYPVFNLETGQQLKHRFGYYFKDLDDYYTSKNPEYIKWSDDYKQISYEAFLFFDDMEYNEFRY